VPAQGTLLEKLEREMKAARTFFWVMMLVLILAVYFLEYEFQWPLYFKELLRDIRIALQISFVIFLLEQKVRRIHLEQIQGNVLYAALKIPVPEQLANELIMVLKAPVYRKNLHYHIRLFPCESAAIEDSENYLIVAREVSYTLCNDTPVKQRYYLSSYSDNNYPVPVDERAFGLKIDGREIRLQRLRTGTLFKQLDRLRVKGGLISPLSLDDGVEFSYELTIPPAGRRKIRIRSQEVVRLDERNLVLTFRWPTINLSVETSNNHPKVADIAVDLNHRDGAELEPTSKTSYSFPGGLLPGQSFEVSWKIKPGGSAEGRTAARRDDKPGAAS
jgi:hypothetical protein